MKRLALALAIVVCTALTASAFKMDAEPLGWYGWAWGTSTKDIRGWLNFKNQLALPCLGPVPQEAYTRQGQEDAYFGKQWQDTYYLFEKDKLCGVVLVTADPADVGRAIAYYGKDVATELARQPMSYYGKGGAEVKGRASEESRSMVFYYAAAKGARSSFLYISEPVFFNRPEEVFLVKHYVVIGEKRVVDGWIDRVSEGL